MNLLAIDPGGTNGVVLLDWNGSPEPDPDALQMTRQVPFADMPVFLDGTLSLVEQVVIERFLISPRTVRYTRQPEALYVIGGTMFLAQLRGIPVKLQSKSDADDIPAEEMARWRTVKGPHARDALRHALLACKDRTLYSSV